MKDLSKINHDNLLKCINDRKESLTWNTRTNNINVNDINNGINGLINNKLNHLIIKIMNIIEWTPEKMCLEVYFLTREEDHFWLVKYSGYDGYTPYYYTSIKYILEDRITKWINKSESFLRLYHNQFPSNDELINAVMILNKSKNGDYKLIKVNHIHHYVCRYNNCIIYVPFNYAPLMLCSAI